MIYRTGGIAAVNSDEYNIGDEVKQDDQGSDNTGWRWGWVVGAGVGTWISDHWTGKIEYLHVGMADNEGHGIKNNGRSTYTYVNDPYIVRVGVNYKLNEYQPPEALIDRVQRRHGEAARVAVVIQEQLRPLPLDCFAPLATAWRGQD